MRARVVVFPIKGRNWCFSRSRDPASVGATSEHSSPSIKDLWVQITARGRKPQENAEALVDFFADKMNRAWSGFENASEGTFKNKIHSLGLWLLSRVRPSEIFLKSVSKDVTALDITYPMSFNPRLVRRRLRHIAMRGAAIHRNKLYGSVCLLPITSVFTVLPLPNVPFFWILFRTYSNWRALQGSERLRLLVSDSSSAWHMLKCKEKEDDSEQVLPDSSSSAACHSPWALQPSKELERIIDSKDLEKGLDCGTISEICKVFDLEKKEIVKYRENQ
ncbi:Mitochondrial K+-H+ exchange-related [Carex littledalei]|uniref:Mitochondrial K+-H+ exchange-related n=1 Tax=Carex littledalei TaxID=544730 RepID=A0A833VL48_9POAL|nr:Mitochondrial K+-H+ exchange-related [Carex littledalei]